MGMEEGYSGGRIFLTPDDHMHMTCMWQRSYVLQVDNWKDIPNSGRPHAHDVHVAEELCSPSRQLEKAVVRLQQDIADYRAELELNRTQDSGGRYSASETVGVYVDVSS